ncbi:uncharacterized protein LOC111595420 [Drosophila hydei]|uniref:Uncharacterized protein LOC111595420 n=1 Tax=Drosophila hydei TaxID=7224 RepID=A0A6J1LD94_DROHY|nr:uncharacterized protein LOC111595420 [Drosophila hydei]
MCSKILVFSLALVAFYMTQLIEAQPSHYSQVNREYNSDNVQSPSHLYIDKQSAEPNAIDDTLEDKKYIVDFTDNTITTNDGLLSTVIIDPPMLTFPQVFKLNPICRDNGENLNGRCHFKIPKERSIYGWPQMYKKKEKQLKLIYKLKSK